MLLKIPAEAPESNSTTAKSIEKSTPVQKTYTTITATPAPTKPPLVTSTYGIKTPTPAPKATTVKVETVDYSMVEVGAEVTHKAFGTGKVTWIDKAGKHIRVEFAAGEKTFIFPDAFKQGFLKAN